MISLLTPTRGRPDRFRAAIESALDLHLPELSLDIVAVLDDDDPTADQYPDDLGVTYVQVPRQIQSHLWNIAWEHANPKSQYAMMYSDDILMRQKYWNVFIEAGFDQWDDKLGCVWFPSGGKYGNKNPCFPVTSREWIDLVGFFTPPWFKSWFADKWIQDVAESVGRIFRIPWMLGEHMHENLGKADLDQTYIDAVNFRKEEDPTALYNSHAMNLKRAEQAKLVRGVIWKMKNT